MSDLHKEMHEYYKRQNTVDKWIGYFALAWVGIFIGIPLLLIIAS